MLKVKIEGHILIDDVIADALQYLMCDQWVEKICKGSTKYTIQQMNDAIRPLSSQLHAIVEARRLAVNGINEKYRQKNIGV